LWLEVETVTRYRRRSASGQLLNEAARVGNRVSWQTSLVVGAVLFCVLFWVVPAWMTSWVEARQSGMHRSIINTVLFQRIHWLKWLAVAIALLFAYFAARSYAGQRSHSHSGERDTSFLARLLARLFT
jgi:hypothetical protein